MDWHRRYLQQALWTRDLRTYIFNKTRLDSTSRLLEVGCGTGAILSEVPTQISRHGLDLNFTALTQCQLQAPTASLVQGNGLALPYSNQIFDLVYCHFLLLWVDDPLQALLEMKRVARRGGYVIAFAEPDYTARIDEPQEMVQLGEWQTESLRRQGADPDLGSRLAELFFQAGIRIVETGTIQNASQNPAPEEWEKEWAVIESDLTGFIPTTQIQELKRLDQQARANGERRLFVPTHFAWGQV